MLTNKEGNRIEGKSSNTYKYGTIESSRTESTYYRTKNGNKVGNVDIHKIRGDKNANEIYEFLVNNTSVEWSQFATGEAGDKGLNFITTGHERGLEPGAIALFNGQLKNGYTIREHTHNHPSGISIPSDADYDFMEMILDGIKPQRPSFYIFTRKDGRVPAIPDF